jgi:hypothetical protein
MILEPDILDSVYRQWRAAQRITPSRNFWDKYITYQTAFRNGPPNKFFEEWLFEQGFAVIQKDRKRYLKFSGDPQQLTWFLLKYGE